METTKELKGITLDVSFKIDFDRIYNLLVSAFEGGSNYWYMIQGKIKPKNFDNFRDVSSNGVEFISCYPLNEDGAILIDDSAEGEGTGQLKNPVELDLKRCELGLRLMATKYPRHFANFLNEDDDAETADVFLQCAVLGEVVYG